MLGRQIDDKKVICKTIQLSLIILTIICTVFSVSVLSLAASAQEEKSTDICVIDDNSGSTYQDETWCRYKYVLEVMASLVDYDSGGRMYIYPLCDVSIDGRESSASCEPISITSYADIGKISNMLTTTPANTPFEPVESAYNYLIRDKLSVEYLFYFVYKQVDSFLDRELFTHKELLSIQIIPAFIIQLSFINLKRHNYQTVFDSACSNIELVLYVRR